MSHRAGLYLRISQDRTGEGLGIARQREDCQALCERRGWAIVEEFVDNDVSAYTGKRRPAYEKMLTAVQEGRVDAVVVWDLDRLTRRPIEIEHFIELADEHRLALGSVGGDVDISTDNGRLYMRIKAAVARSEVDAKSRRQRRARQQEAAAGLSSGGPRAFGYTRDGLHLDPDEALALAQCYARFLAGMSLGGLAAWLNSQGITTSRGYRWSYNTMRWVLANPRNAGLRGTREIVNERTRARATRPRIAAVAVWPQIVEEATWRAAGQILDDPTRRTYMGVNTSKHLLAGLAVCGVEGCGLPLRTGGRQRPQGVRVLRCPTDRHVSRRADYIEAYVVAQVIGYLSGPGRDAWPRADTTTDVDLDAIRSETVTLRARMRGLAADYADGLFDREGVRVAGDRIRARLSELDDTVAGLGAVDVTAGLRAAVDPEAFWDEQMSLSQRRAVIAAAMTVRVMRGRPGRPGGLRFHPDTVQIVWRTT